MNKESLKQQFISEGFPIVYEWTDGPNTEYMEHMHQGNVSFYVTRGEVHFLTGIERIVKEGERIDVPIGVLHTARVGLDGCDYVIGQEIEGDA